MSTIWLRIGLGCLGLIVPILTVAEDKATISYEHWNLECRPSPGDKRPPCHLYQNVVLAPEQGGGRVMRVTVGQLVGAESPVALFVLPLGIALPPGVELAVPGGSSIRFPLERCEPAGCGGGLKLDAEILQSLRNAEFAWVRFRDGQREPVELRLSLQGFSAGLDALIARVGRAPQP